MISLGGASPSELKSIVDILPIRYAATLLHCIPKYPCAPRECNLQIIKQLRRLVDVTIETEFRIGWSDHTASPLVIHQAIAMGASVIEMHFDLNDSQGAETKHRHVWTSSNAAQIIYNTKLNQQIIGNNLLKDNEKIFEKERLLRASDFDGLRPLEEIRKVG